MPALATGKVLVSGASGFIAAWVVKRLLEEGYSVRGTVRSKPKGEYLSNLFKSFGDKFEYVIVEDIEKEGAFDEAVKGMDAIEHTASPFHNSADDPEELLGPAIKGTVGILDSVLKNAPQVKRVVITSSCAAVYDTNSKVPGVFSEKDWNISSGERIKEKGRDVPQVDKYRGSKALAERAAWKWMDVHKGQIGFDLAVMNPPFVFGPIIHEVPKVESLNTSVNIFYKVLKGDKTDDELAAHAGCWIDVRDLAQAHMRAIQVEEAGGSRYVLSTSSFAFQDLLDGLNTPEFSDLRKGKPGAGKDAKHMVMYDSSLAQRVLGIKFTNVGDCARDMTSSLRDRGWLEA